MPNPINPNGAVRNLLTAPKKINNFQNTNAQYFGADGNQLYPTYGTTDVVRDTANFKPYGYDDNKRPIFLTKDQSLRDLLGRAPGESFNKETGELHFNAQSLKSLNENSGQSLESLTDNSIYDQYRGMSVFSDMDLPQKANGGTLYDPNLPQYGFGDWLQGNAGMIGMGVGAVAGGLVGGPMGASLGASLGGSVGGSIQGNFDQNEAADAQMESMQQQEQQQQYQNQINTANQQLQNNGMQQRDFAGTNSFALGGPLSNNQNGSQGLISYDGATHENGGIEVDAQGSPSAISGEQPVGEVEDGEKSWTSPDGKVYIFSNRLKV